MRAGGSLHHRHYYYYTTSILPHVKPREKTTRLSRLVLWWWSGAATGSALQTFPPTLTSSRVPRSESLAHSALSRAFLHARKTSARHAAVPISRSALLPLLAAFVGALTHLDTHVRSSFLVSHHSAHLAIGTAAAPCGACWHVSFLGQSQAS